VQQASLVVFLLRPVREAVFELGQRPISWSPQVIKEHQLAVIGQEKANKNFMSFFIGW
jgi:hypothetical protein